MRSNRLQGLEDSAREWQKDQACMHDIAVNYFTTLFQSGSSRQEGEAVACVEDKVNYQDNEKLIRPF